MRTVGLIVEYNPLHNGHYYHFQQSKKESEADAAICVMSGHFLQRGEPAVVNKWARTEMALAMGADLVLELPIAFAVQPAEWFAYGAVSVLEATGITDNLCFGSESGSLELLTRAADLLADEPPAFREALREELTAGLPYPTAYSRTVARFVPGTEESELAKPNNTLGLHYLIALRRLKSKIQPLTIRRTKADYSQTSIGDEAIASATAIRKLLFEEQSLQAIRPYVPAATADILEREWRAGRAPLHWGSFARPLLHQLMTQTPEELSDYGEVTEGLEYRIFQALREMPGIASDGAVVDPLLDLLKTKRYTRTKLQRMLLHIMLGHRKRDLTVETLRKGAPYIRVLGFSPKGQELLKQMKTKAKAPVVTKVTREPSSLLAMDLRASSAYALAYRDQDPQQWLRDYYEPPLRTRGSLEL